MSDLTFGIRLTADGNAFVGNVKLARDELRKTKEEATGLQGKFDGLVGSLKGFAAGFVGFEAVGKLRELSDETSTLMARFRNATATVQEFASAQAQVRAIATQNQFAFRTIADGMIEMSEAAREMGGNAQTAIELAASLSAAARSQGMSADQARQSMQQMATVLTLGVQGGREFTSMLRQNADLARALASQLGVTTVELKRMASEGELSGARLAEALIKARGELEKTAAAMPRTIGGALQEMADEIGRQFSGAGSGGRALADWLHELADSLRLVTTLGLNFADRMSLALAGLAGGFGGITQKLRELGSRMATGRIGGQDNAMPQGFGSAQEEAALRTAIDKSQTVEGARARAEKARKDVLLSYDIIAAANKEGVEKWKAIKDTLIRDINAKEREELEALSKRGQASFASLTASLEQRTAIITGGYDSALRVEQDALQRRQTMLDQSHSLALASDRDYIAESGRIAAEGVQLEIEAIRGKYAELVQELAALQAIPAVGADAREQKQQKIAKLTQDITKLVIDWSLAEGKLGDATRATDVAQEQRNRKVLEDLTKINREVEDYNRALNDRVGDLQTEIDLIGKSPTVQRQIRTEMELRREVQRQILTIQREIADLEERGADASIIAAKRRQMDEYRASVEQTVPVLRDLIAAEEQAKETQSTIEDAWRGVKDFFMGTVEAMKGGWKRGVEYMRDTLKSVLLRGIAELAAKRIVLPIFASVLGLSNANASALGTSGGGGGILNLAGLFGGGGGGLLSGFGDMIFGGGGGAAFGAGLSSPLSTLSEIAGILSGGGEFASLGLAAASGLGALVPVIGGALAIASLFGAFKKDPSKVKGQFGIQAGTGGFEDNAYTKSKFGNLGFLDAGTQYFSGEAGNVFSKIIGGTLDAFAARMSKEQIASTATKLQGLQFPGAEGEYTTEDFIKQYGGEVMRKVIVAALEELDPAMAKLVDRFKGTADETSAYTNSLLKLHDALSADPVTDAAEVWRVSQRSSMEALREQGDALRKLASDFDGSASATEQLAQATDAYRGSLTAMLVQIKESQLQVGKMFASTREQLETSGLSGDDLYNYFSGKANSLLAQIAKESDPKTISQLSEQLNSYLLQAFNALDPERQGQLKNPLLEYLNQADAFVQQRLGTLFDTTASEGADPLKSVRTALDKAAGDMQAAATDQKIAAAGMNDAAGQFRAAAASLRDIRITVQQDSGGVLRPAS